MTNPPENTFKVGHKVKVKKHVFEQVFVDSIGTVVLVGMTYINVTFPKSPIAKFPFLARELIKVGENITAENYSID